MFNYMSRQFSADRKQERAGKNQESITHSTWFNLSPEQKDRRVQEMQEEAKRKLDLVLGRS